MNFYMDIHIQGIHIMVTNKYDFQFILNLEELLTSTLSRSKREKMMIEGLHVNLVLLCRTLNYMVSP